MTPGVRLGSGTLPLQFGTLPPQLLLLLRPLGRLPMPSGTRPRGLLLPLGLLLRPLGLPLGHKTHPPTPPLPSLPSLPRSGTVPLFGTLSLPLLGRLPGRLPTLPGTSMPPLLPLRET